MHYRPYNARKPVGGFIFLTVQQLCLLWWAYRTRLIQLRDFRIWFAAQEMAARRCQMDPGQVPTYTPGELHGLVGGVGGEHLRTSLRRLDALGLLIWTSTTLTFATSPADLRQVSDLTGLYTMLQTILHPQRLVPVPRHTIRLIAGGCRATVIATMFGHLIRCLYYREHRCVSGGWCKASWIAEVFRVDLRNIKAARTHLVAIGWLQMLPLPQRLCNRWGSYSRISLSWTRAPMAPALQDSGHLSSPGSPPPLDFSTTELPLPYTHQQPFQEFKHQQPTLSADSVQPAPSCPTLAPTSWVMTGGRNQGKDRTRTPTTPPPTLRHIVLNDLQDTARLLVLFEQAHTQGLIDNSESERLTFLATAEHARVRGSSNPCGLFAELIRRQCWDFVTDSDEDAAYRRLKRHLYGPDSPRAAPAPGTPAPPALSKDAAIVRYLQTELGRAGFQGDVFGLVSQEDASWTRARWECATAELALAQATWQRANVLNRIGDLKGVGDALDLLEMSTAEEDSGA